MKDDGAEGSVEFDDWVVSRSGALTRFAYLLTGSEPAAEHAITSALTIACSTWSRVRRTDDPEAQVWRLVVQAYLSPGGLLRRWRAPIAVPTNPPRPAPEPAAASKTDDAETDDAETDDAKTDDAKTDDAKTDDAGQAWRLCATLPPQQRAAVVLRCYAEMTYPQIAAAMGGKEMVARTHVEQSFAALGLAIAKPRSDAELEGAFREAFAEHAEDVDDVGDRAARAHAGARDRRRRHVLSAAAVATVLVAGLAGAALSYDGGDATAAATKPGTHPAAWRAESYNGIQLWVPTSWGWGEVPRRSIRGLVGCDFGAYSPTAEITNLRYVLRRGGAPPYVGRPVAPRRDCLGPASTSTPHVWFDSPLPVGSGPGQTTVSVTGLTTFNVTVADTNLSERRAILASVERVTVDDYGCPRDANGVLEVESVSQPEPPPRLVRTMSLCLFGASGGREVLYYSTRLDGPAAREAAANVERGPSPGLKPVCLVTPALYQVALIARTAIGPSVFVVKPGTCPQEPVGYVTGSGYHVLTEDSLRLWAIDGLSLYSSPDPRDERLSPVVPSP